MFRQTSRPIRSLASGLVLLLLPALLGCQPDAESPVAESYDRMKKEVSEAVDAISEYSFERKDEVVESLREKLENREETIQQMQQKAAELSGKAKEDLETKIDVLKQKSAQLRGELDEAAAGGREAWKEVRKGLENAWTEYNRAYEEAQDEAQQEAPQEADQP